MFIVYPEAISQMPLPQLWAILFFIMLIFLGFSSEVSTQERGPNRYQDLCVSSYATVSPDEMLRPH